MENKRKQLLFLMKSVCLISTIVKIKKKRKRPRRLWSESWLLRRDEGRGLLNIWENELRTEDQESYKNFVRMCSSYFDELLYMIQDKICKKNTCMRESISAGKRLAVTLRYLATGETYRALMYSTRIHKSTISLIVPEVCVAIYECLKNKYLKMPSSEEEWLKISSDFELLWNFPMCLGAVDGKYVSFQAPRSSAARITLLAISDASYKFTYIDVVTNGRIDDGYVFRESSLKKVIDANILSVPSNKSLTDQNEVPYVFVAYDAFPLSNRILKLYPNHELTKERRIFNYRLSRALGVVENAFGILCNRFRVLRNKINLDVKKVETITLAVCALHNFLATKNHNFYTNLEMENSNLTSLQEQQVGNLSAQEAIDIRDSFCNYFNTIGTV